MLCELKIDDGPVLPGEISVSGHLSDIKKMQLQVRLSTEGFKLLDDKKTRLIERIKLLLMERVGKDADEVTDNFSDFLQGVYIRIIITSASCFPR